jgi:hypothetical protein
MALRLCGMPAKIATVGIGIIGGWQCGAHSFRPFGPLP